MAIWPTTITKSKGHVKHWPALLQHGRFFDHLSCNVKNIVNGVQSPHAPPQKNTSLEGGYFHLLRYYLIFTESFCVEHYERGMGISRTVNFALHIGWMTPKTSKSDCNDFCCWYKEAGKVISPKRLLKTTFIGIWFTSCLIELWSNEVNLLGNV